MTYILIAYLMFSQKGAAVSVEFNSLESCKAAAAEISKQYQEKGDRYPYILLCAKK